jgi:hypothetical protein
MPPKFVDRVDRHADVRCKREPDVYAAIFDHECNPSEVRDRCSQRKRSSDFADVRHGRDPISTTAFLSRTAASGVQRTCRLRWMLSTTVRLRLEPIRVPPQRSGMPPWRAAMGLGHIPELSVTRVGGHGRGLARRPRCCLDVTSPSSEVARLLAAYPASGRPGSLGGIPSCAVAKGRQDAEPVV